MRRSTRKRTELRRAARLGASTTSSGRQLGVGRSGRGVPFPLAASRAALPRSRNVAVEAPRPTGGTLVARSNYSITMYFFGGPPGSRTRELLRSRPLISGTYAVGEYPSKTPPAATGQRWVSVWRKIRGAPYLNLALRPPPVATEICVATRTYLPIAPLPGAARCEAFTRRWVVVSRNSRKTVRRRRDR
jgi:hypothetical protein